jgi:putative hemolysin
VEEAQRTAGIERGEGRMIKNVLDMQGKEVRNIMQPRVDMVAVPVDATAQQILEIAAVTKYSRIPIFREDIDHIVGVVFAKDLLDLVYYPQQYQGSKGSSPSHNQTAILKDRRDISGLLQLNNASKLWNEVSALDIMEDTYFIPETMSTWNALQEMRKRRVHLAVVVDEYGGTAGLVTLEDILEEVVGEIYDEDDGEEEQFDSSSMFMREDGSYIILGSAPLDDVCEVLGLGVEENTLGEYSTIGGYLCAVAGEIPSVGDVLELVNYRFMVLEVEENRRIVSLSVEKRAEANEDADGTSVDVDSITSSADSETTTDLLGDSSISDSADQEIPPAATECVSDASVVAVADSQESNLTSQLIDEDANKTSKALSSN